MGVQIRKKGKRPHVAPWAQIKEEWITENMDPNRKDPYELKQLAMKWGVKLTTMYLAAKRENWKDQLRDRKQAIAEASIERVQENELFNETVVRMRQASISREAYEKALLRLRMLTPEKMDNKTMVALLRLGLDGERLALGLPQTYQFVPPTVANPTGTGEYKPVIEHINEQQKMKQLGHALLKFVERM